MAATKHKPKPKAPAEVVDLGIVSDLLSTPPIEKHRAGHHVRRVARVALTWNEASQGWDWHKPEGVSDYAEAIKPATAAGK